VSDLPTNTTVFAHRVEDKPDLPHLPNLWPGGVVETTCALCLEPTWAMAYWQDVSVVCTRCYATADLGTTEGWVQ
jgi:hypothetical protein